MSKLANWTLPYLYEDNADFVVADLVVQLYRDFPSGDLDIRFFLTKWTDMTIAKVEHVIRILENGWSRLRDGRLIVKWSNRSAINLIHKLFLKLSRSVRMPDISISDMKFGYFLAKGKETDETVEEVPNYMRACDSLQKISQLDALDLEFLLDSMDYAGVIS